MPDPRFAAKRVLDELGIRDPGDLQALDLIAWERGALVREAQLDGAEARLTVARRRAIITVSTAIRDPRRKRFSIAHELGHLELHRRNGMLALCLSEDIDTWRSEHPRSGLELQANEFAAALLLPEKFFSPLCVNRQPSLNYISELADTFNVSLTATARCYSQYCDELICIVFSQANHIRWFQGSKEFEELRDELGFFIDVRSRLDPRSLAAKLFQGTSISNEQKPVAASVWFTPGKYRSDAIIQEQSIPMPSYDAVLTLLWIDDDIEDEEEDFF
jgi:hypothetical protein